MYRCLTTHYSFFIQNTIAQSPRSVPGGVDNRMSKYLSNRSLIFEGSIQGMEMSDEEKEAVREKLRVRGREYGKECMKMLGRKKC